MILSGRKISEEFLNGKIIITPFDEGHINSNSYDLTLGNEFVRYTEEILDPAIENSYEKFTADAGGVSLKGGDFILSHSLEIIGSNHYVPIIHARSSIARLGLFVHVTADLIDIGSVGNITFQLFSTLPIKIYPGMKIGQVSFWKPLGEISLYEGKYQGSSGVKTSQSYRDFAQPLTSPLPV